MVVVSHFFSFFDKKLGEGVNRYESHPPSLRTVYFPTASSYKIICYTSVCPIADAISFNLSMA